MAETITTIRTTLVTRLGLDTTTTAEDSRLSEIVNASVAVVLGDYVPGMAEILVGKPAGTLAVTISSHSAGSATITLTGTPADTRRGDIFTDANGVDYIIRSVASAVIDVGIPVPDALTGTCSILRRTLLLPDHGSVESVRRGTNGNTPLRAGIWGGETNSGTPSHYQQIWDAGESFVLLFPAPTGGTERFIIHQHRALAKDAAIDAPNGVIERILHKAVVMYTALSTGNYGALEQMHRDAKDLSGESAGGGVYIK